MWRTPTCLDDLLISTAAGGKQLPRRLPPRCDKRPLSCYAAGVGTIQGNLGLSQRSAFLDLSVTRRCGCWSATQSGSRTSRRREINAGRVFPVTPALFDAPVIAT